MSTKDKIDFKSDYNLVNRSNNNGDSGPTLLPPKSGPENDLIKRFLLKEPLKTSQPYTTTIYCEPRLDSGIPDLVAVIWDEHLANTWPKTRMQFNKNDIRLLHFIYQKRTIQKSELYQSFEQNIEFNLNRLLESNVIEQTRNRFFTKPLSKIFAVKRIIAIEAKMNSWGVALSQAIMNTWFASESYILLPELSSNSNFRQTAQHHGIQILDDSLTQLKVKPSASRLLPRSYASWLFNEWVWREKLVNGRIKD